MRIKSIVIKNFKGFEERKFSFSGQFTLLIGDNGTGKTSVLEALTVGLGGYLNGFDGVNSRNISLDEVRRERIHMGDATVSKEKQYPVEIVCEAETGNDVKVIKWKRTLNSEAGKTTRQFSKDIIDYAKMMQQKIKKEKNQDVVLPIIAYHSAGRMWSQKREKWEDPFEKEEVSRFLGYTDCLETESNIKLFVRWLRRMTLIQLQKSKAIGELNAVIDAVKAFLQGLVEDNTEVGLQYDFEEEEVVVNVGEKSIPLRMMSAGYRTVIGMVADIAYRMALLNPQLKESAAKETPGVVLIDELDLHLHPKWQWRIVKDLKRTFPKVQFITTTHAPIIIASCDKSELIHLYEENGKVIDVSQQTPNGWSIEDVLTEIMGAPARSPETESIISRIRELYLKKIDGEISESEKEELKTKSQYIKEQLPQRDPAVTLAKMDAIEKDLFGSDNDA